MRRLRAEQAGCDLFLVKPCLPNELLRQIRCCCRANDGESRAVALEGSHRVDRAWLTVTPEEPIGPPAHRLPARPASRHLQQMFNEGVAAEKKNVAAHSD